jgi:hypothetical protein
MRVKLTTQQISLSIDMNPKSIEEDMRRALFGDSENMSRDSAPPTPPPSLVTAITQSSRPAEKKTAAKPFTPKLRVTLRVGNEFEGQTHELIHDVDTMSTLLAEQEATKAARKKFRFVELVSVISM